MRSPHRSRCAFISAIVVMLAISSSAIAQSSGNRLLGLDVSAYQGSISQTTWNNIFAVENRQFTFIRASRGGTTGEDHRQGGYPSNDNTLFTFSQRYDDPYFVQNINRATTAGLFAGSYHFSRADVTTNTGTDEANHFIQMAGAFMRPGYLPPVHDLEAGDGIRSDTDMATFSLDFSNRIYQVMGIRPAIYLNGNYAQSVLGGATATQRSQLAQQASNPPNLAGPAYSQVWSARWPTTVNVQTDHPKDSFANIYGPWDDYGVTHPWVFWQYTSTGRLNSYNGGASNLDLDVVQGGIDYLKDQLIPALWMNDSSGDWGTLLNWNSGQPAIVPIASPGQLTPFATGPLPTPRFPGAAGTGPTAGSNDTVILDRPNADITITLSSGAYTIRKLYVREAFNITGGSLTINYVPVAESTPMAAQFSAPVSISGGASLSVHTVFVDPTNTFSAGGNASLTFDTLTLIRGSTPAKFVVNGDVSITGLGGVTAKIGTNTGVSNTGVVDLAGAVRTFTVTNGAAVNDLDISIPVTNGGVTKSGAGTMVLSGSSTYTGTTTVTAGTLSVTGSLNSLSVQVNGGDGVGGTLQGTGTINGAVAVTGGSGANPVPGSIRGGVSIGTLTLTQALSFGPGGRLIVEIGSGNAVTATHINTGASTDIVNLPNNQTRNSFIHIAGVPMNSLLHPDMLVSVDGTATSFAPGFYSFLVMDGAGSQNFSIYGGSNGSQFNFTGINVVPGTVSLVSDLDGKVYLNFSTAAVPEPMAILGVSLMTLTVLRRRLNLI